MRDHMEKVNPAGVNRLEFSAETSPVPTPLIGRILARAFTVMTPNSASTFNIFKNLRFIVSLYLKTSESGRMFHEDHDNSVIL